MNFWAHILKTLSMQGGWVPCGHYILLTLDILKNCLLKRQLKICNLCISIIYFRATTCLHSFFELFLFVGGAFQPLTVGNVTKYTLIFCGRMQQNCQHHSREKLSECPGHQHTNFVAFVCEWWTWYYCKGCWLNFIIGVSFFDFWFDLSDSDIKVFYYCCFLNLVFGLSLVGITWSRTKIAYLLQFDFLVLFGKWWFVGKAFAQLRFWVFFRYK